MNASLDYLKKYIETKYPCVEIFNEELLEHFLRQYPESYETIKIMLECADKFLLFERENCKKKYAKLGCEVRRSLYLKPNEAVLYLVLYLDYEYIKNIFYERDYVNKGDEHKFARKIDKAVDLFNNCFLSKETFLFPFVSVDFVNK